MEDNNKIEITINNEAKSEISNNETTINTEKTTNKLAVTSLVLSLVGLLIAGLPCGLAALITGIIGLVKFNPETEKGKGMAIAGIIVGVVDMIMVIFYMVIRTAINM